MSSHKSSMPLIYRKMSAFPESTYGTRSVLAVG